MSADTTMLVIGMSAAGIPPPPCGEGMGVGVSFRGTSIVFSPTAALAHLSKTRPARVFTPPLTPPHQGEGNPSALVSDAQRATPNFVRALLG
jgi:hypothetical protein